MQEKVLKISPLVSIIMPCFNRGDYIEESILSVINQTFENWELIVVDDGSIDNSVEIIKNYADKDNRIKLLHRNREPKGACTCRNIGLEESNGEYIIYLDSDDLLASNCLETRIAQFRIFPDYDFLVFQTLLFENKIDDLKILWNIETEENDLIRFLRIDALWQTSGPIYKKRVLLELNGFNESLEFWQDYDLHLKLLFNGFSYLKLFNLEPDNYHRKHKNSISRSISFTSNIDILKNRIKFFEKTYLYLINSKLNSSKNRKLIVTIIYKFKTFMLTEHKSLELFSEEINSLNKNLRGFRFTLLINSFYLKHFHAENKNLLYILFVKAYRVVFSHLLFDSEILEKTSLFKIRLK